MKSQSAPQFRLHVVRVEDQLPVNCGNTKAQRHQAGSRATESDKAQLQMKSRSADRYLLWTCTLATDSNTSGASPDAYGHHPAAFPVHYVSRTPRQQSLTAFAVTSGTCRAPVVRDATTGYCSYRELVASEMIPCTVTMSGRIQRDELRRSGFIQTSPTPRQYNDLPWVKRHKWNISLNSFRNTLP